METLVGYAINHKTIKDLFGEYRVKTILNPNRFYTLIGKLENDGFYVSYQTSDHFRDKIYWDVIKVKGIGKIRAISIALAFQSYEDFQLNPYTCVLHFALDFDLIDKLALTMGFKKDSFERLTALVIYKLIETGDTIWTKKQIESVVDNEVSDKQMENMTFIKLDGSMFYVLRDIKEAVEIILSKRDKIRCITGLAGTGKTTMLADMYKAKNGYIVAFTAKAAQRVNEVLGEDVAMTIHRLIASNPTAQDVIYIDEASMVNTILLSKLMEAVDSSKYILIGDYNQLPAIGGGNPFLDFCETDDFETIILGKIWRTDSSDILTIASEVLNGNYPKKSCNDFKLGKTNRLYPVIEQNKDAMFLTFTNNQRRKINTLVRQVVNHNEIISYKYKDFAMGDKVIHLKNNYNFNIFNSDMGKIVYLDKYCIGVKYEKVESIIYYMDSKLNVRIFDEIEGVKIATCGAGDIYKKGWKVTLISNQKVEPNMYTVDLAYCLTVHKAQGSEANNVVICVDSNPYITNQWLYTAITRAKLSCKLLASEETLEYAVNNYDRRNTYLRYIINGK